MGKVVEQIALLLGSYAAEKFAEKGYESLVSLFMNDKKRFLQTITAMLVAEPKERIALQAWAGDDEDRRSAVHSAIEAANEISSKAGFVDSLDADGEVGGDKIADMRQKVAVFTRAKGLYERAVSAAGSPQHLDAIETWLNVDSDLRRLVKDDAGRK